jgi:hypothetical protein
VTDTKTKQKVDDCFKIVELFRVKPAKKENVNQIKDEPVSECGKEKEDDDDDEDNDDDDADDDDDDDNTTLYTKITKLNDDSQKKRWLFPFLLCSIFFVMLFFAATWHADSAFPWEEDPASDFYTLTRDAIRNDLGLKEENDPSQVDYIISSQFVDFLNALSERWFWNEDGSTVVRIGLVKFAFTFNKNSEKSFIDSNVVNLNASFSSNMTCGSVQEDESTSFVSALFPDLSIDLGDDGKLQRLINAQNASSNPIFESARLKFTLYSHAAKSLLHCDFHFRNVATSDLSVHQKFTQLHSTFPWEEKQWYSLFMNDFFLPFVFCLALIPYIVKVFTFWSSRDRIKSFSKPPCDYLRLNTPSCIEYLGPKAVFKDRRSLFMRTIAQSKFITSCKRGFLLRRIVHLFPRPGFVSLVFSLRRIICLFPWPELISLILIIFAAICQLVTNYKLSLLFSRQNFHNASLQSVAVAYGSFDVDITSDRWTPFWFYWDTRSSVQLVRYFLSAYIVLFAWRLLSYLALCPASKPVFHALQMTIVSKNVMIFVGFILVFSVVFAMSGLIAFGREDEQHYGTPWNSWKTSFLYLTAEEQARNILSTPFNVLSSNFDLSFLFPFGQPPPPLLLSYFIHHSHPQVSISYAPFSAPSFCAISSCKCSTMCTVTKRIKARARTGSIRTSTLLQLRWSLASLQRNQSHLRRRLRLMQKGHRTVHLPPRL